jgi:cytochrome c553
LDKKEVLPSSDAHLKVLFNSANREFGQFAKFVTIRLSAPPYKTIVGFHGQIVMPIRPHGNAMTIQGIFSGLCGQCHAERGRGQIGRTLYEADCAICHGNPAEHKPAPDLLTIPTNLDQDYLFQTILNGKRGSNMPAFDWQKGGPLTDQEIRTLCQYIQIERLKLHTPDKKSS